MTDQISPSTIPYKTLCVGLTSNLKFDTPPPHNFGWCSKLWRSCFEPPAGNGMLVGQGPKIQMIGLLIPNRKKKAAFRFCSEVLILMAAGSLILETTFVMYLHMRSAESRSLRRQTLMVQTPEAVNKHQSDSSEKENSQLCNRCSSTVLQNATFEDTAPSAVWNEAT